MSQEFDIFMSKERTSGQKEEKTEEVNGPKDDVKSYSKIVKLSLSVQYKTEFGESICVVGSIP